MNLYIMRDFKALKKTLFMLLVRSPGNVACRAENLLCCQESTRSVSKLISDHKSLFAGGTSFLDDSSR